VVGVDAHVAGEALGAPVVVVLLEHSRPRPPKERSIQPADEQFFYEAINDLPLRDDALSRHNIDDARANAFDFIPLSRDPGLFMSEKNAKVGGVREAALDPGSGTSTSWG